MTYYLYNYTIQATYLAPRENSDDYIKQEQGKFTLDFLGEQSFSALEQTIKALYNVKYLAIKSVTVTRELA